MDVFLRAVETFFDRLAAVGWGMLAIAVCCHLAKILAVTRAWQNVIRAAYPKADVRYRTAFGAYAAGVGVNAVIPARSGELVKLYIAKRRVEGSTYTTLGATIVVMTVFDFVVGASLLLWATSVGVLPNPHVLSRIPDFDFSWFFAHPRVSSAIGIGLAVALAAAGLWAFRRVAAFKRRVAQGFAVMRDFRAYLRRVVSWQIVEWMFRLATIFFFLKAFSIPATAYNAFLVQVTQSIATVFPFSPGGIGTEQALILFVLGDEASRSALLAFSVGSKITTTIVNVAVGFAAIAITLRTLRWRRLAEADARPRPAPAAERTG